MKFEKICAFVGTLLSLIFAIPVFCLAKINEKSAWIATVYSLDWPKSQDAESHKKELTDMLEKLENIYGFSAFRYEHLSEIFEKGIN